MRSVNQTYNEWKELCKHGSAPQINGGAAQAKEHIVEAEELLDEMQKANGMHISTQVSLIHPFLCYDLLKCQTNAKNRHLTLLLLFSFLLCSTLLLHTYHQILLKETSQNSDLIKKK